MTERSYLGDAVYVTWDGARVVLTTEDGYRETNRIVLEPSTLTALERWIREMVYEARVPMAYSVSCDVCGEHPRFIHYLDDRWICEACMAKERGAPQVGEGK